MFNCFYAYSLPHYQPTPNRNFSTLPFECFKYSKFLQIIFIYRCYLGSGSKLVRPSSVHSVIGIKNHKNYNELTESNCGSHQIGTGVSRATRTDGRPLEPIESIIFIHFHVLSLIQSNQRYSLWQFQLIKSRQRKECYYYARVRDPSNRAVRS